MGTNKERVYGKRDNIEGMREQTNASVIFLHLLRTAGTTLRTILSQQYDCCQQITFDPTDWGIKQREGYKLFSQLPEASRQKARLLMGHLNFGFHEALPQPSQYITLLRNPLNRIVSYYYHTLSRTPDKMKNSYTEKICTLKEYVTGLSKPNRLSDNYMTKILASSKGTLPEGKFGYSKRNCLELAKENLHHYFIVGLTEQFDESLILFKRHLGWSRQPFYFKRNKAKKSAKWDNPGEDLKEIIAYYNPLDFELYEYAQKLFKKQIEAQGNCFQKEVRNFRIQNKILTPIYGSKIGINYLEKQAQLSYMKELIESSKKQ